MFHKDCGIEKCSEKKRPGYHDFPAKLFCLTVPNHSVVEPFSVSPF